MTDLDALGRWRRAFSLTRVVAEFAGDLLDDRVARVADRVDRMPEADDDLLAGDAGADVGLGLVGRAVALLDFVGDLVGAAVLRAAQRADRAGDARRRSPRPCRRSRAAVKVDALNSCSA
jgi:hypothetical protein